MCKEHLHKLILEDIEGIKDIKNIKKFKEYIHLYSTQELKLVLDAINNHIYLGQSNVDDITWLNLKLLIKNLIN